MHGSVARLADCVKYAYQELRNFPEVCVEHVELEKCEDVIRILESVTFESVS